MDTDRFIRAAFAAEVAEGGEPPRELLLVPAGEFRMRPHDGRGPFINSDADAVVATTRSLKLDLPIDYEHQGEFANRNGRPAPAAGWIVRVFARAGEVRGEVEWTERAAAMIRAKEYRYHSPVFLHDKSNRVVAVLSAALTNDPAMFMKALAKAGAPESETDMDPKALRAALGLPEDATDDRVVAAAKAATAAATGLKTVAKAAGLAETAGAAEIETAVKAAASAQKPDPNAYVPRAEFDRVSERLNAVEAERTEERATAAVDGAVKAGKIAPAQRDWAMAYAKSDAKGFADFVKAAPAIVEPGRAMPNGGPQRQAASAGIALPSDRRVDDDRLDLHRRALARAAKDGIGYAAAAELEERAA